MNDLTALKQKLLKQTGSEKDLVFNLCYIMEKVGGYSELMELPIPTLNEYIKYLEYLNRESNKKNR